METLMELQGECIRMAEETGDPVFRKERDGQAFCRLIDRIQAEQIAREHPKGVCGCMNSDVKVCDQPNPMDWAIYRPACTYSKKEDSQANSRSCE